LALVGAVAIAGFDQATKGWALGALDTGRSIPILGHALRLRLTANPGAAFSVGADATGVFTVVTAAVIVGVVVLVPRVQSGWWLLAATLVLGGGVGNLIDRLGREPGFGVGMVVDFIAYGDWFIGNVADIAIVVAVGLIVVLTLVGTRPWPNPPASNPPASNPAQGDLA
jgi:signal peptidase II